MAFAPSVRTNPLRPGHIAVDLWKTSASPVILDRDEDDPTVGPRQIHPPVIQRGTNHAWSNRSDKPCVMLFVLIDAEFEPALKNQFSG